MIGRQCVNLQLRDESCGGRAEDCVKMGNATLDADTNTFSVSARKYSCSEMAEANAKIGVEMCKTDLIRR